MMENDIFAEGLRRVADWYEKHPDFPQPGGCDANGIFNVFAHTKEEALKLKEAFDTSVVEVDDYSINIFKSFGDVQLRIYANRGNVCTKRVVGTKKVLKKEATQWTEREVEEEIVEWDCPDELRAEEKVK